MPAPASRPGRLGAALHPMVTPLPGSTPPPASAVGTPGSTAPPLLVRGHLMAWDQPLLMGVVNASPDSFSDGPEVGDVDAQLARAMALIDDGADIVDIGGQSGITGVPEVDLDLEIRRVVPLVAALRAATDVLISVDTYRPAVVEAVLGAGASIVNDVSGLRHPEVAGLCAQASAGLVVMHTLAVPKQRLNEDALYERRGGIGADVAAFVAERIRLAVARGLDPRSIVVDPGPDFSKTPAQTVRLLRDLGPLVALGRPVLMAVSRKDFVGALTSTPPRERLPGTLAAVGALAGVPGAVFRVHDVAAVRQYLAVAAALAGTADVPAALRLPDHLRRQS